MTARELAGWLVAAFVAIVATVAFLMTDRVSGTPDDPGPRHGKDTAYAEPWPPPDDVRELLREANARFAKCHAELTRHQTRAHQRGEHWTGERWIRK